MSTRWRAPNSNWPRHIRCFLRYKHRNRTSVSRKMLDCSSHREITEFPKTFKYTPYDKTDFTALASAPLHLKVCKIIILGDLCVGKTSLLNRFCHKVFDSNYRTTIGVDFQTEQLCILGVPYHLQIWDTAGQERFKCIAQCYYRKAHVIMLVFDVSSIRTLANCKNWLRDALETSSEAEPPYIFLIGSKKDLLSEEAYKSVESIAEETAKNLNAEFWSVSSKTGENIDDLFYRAAALVFDDQVKSASERSDMNNMQIGSDLVSFKNQHGKRKNRNKCDGFECANGVFKK